MCIIVYRTIDNAIIVRSHIDLTPFKFMCVCVCVCYIFILFIMFSYVIIFDKLYKS